MKKLTLAKLVILFLIALVIMYTMSRKDRTRTDTKHQEKVSTEGEIRTLPSKEIVPPSTNRTIYTDSSIAATSPLSEKSEDTGQTPAQKLAEITGSRDNLFLPQNFEEMGPGQIEDYLRLFTLGGGEEFLRNKDAYIVPVAASQRSRAFFKKLFTSLEGRYHSRFVNSIPAADEPSYTVELFFGKDSLDIYFKLDDKIYYSHKIVLLEENISTSRDPKLPQNIFVELPNKIEQGYQHPLYLQLFPSENERSIGGVLYNTNQRETLVNYVHAEELLFSKQ